ncbi:hypothetical protein AAG906_005703 [Vitis piasezkii]
MVVNSGVVALLYYALSLLNLLNPPAHLQLFFLLPELTLSQLTLTHLTLSQLTLSQLTLTHLTLSQLTLTQLTLSQLTLTQLTLSQLTLTHLTLSQLTLSQLTLSQLTLSQLFLLSLTAHSHSSALHLSQSQTNVPCVAPSLSPSLPVSPQNEHTPSPASLAFSFFLVSLFCLPQKKKQSPPDTCPHLQRISAVLNKPPLYPLPHRPPPPSPLTLRTNLLPQPHKRKYNKC